MLVLGACSPRGENKPEAAAAPTATAASSPAVVTVNGKVITQADIDKVIEQRAKGQALPPEARKALIDSMVLQMLVAQEAAKQGLDKTPAVQEQMEANCPGTVTCSRCGNTAGQSDSSSCFQSSMPSRCHCSKRFAGRLQKKLSCGSLLSGRMPTGNMPTIFLAAT
jgi:alkylation response protein AidB-like acyl-CoA dehydrogenase